MLKKLLLLLCLWSSVFALSAQQEKELPVLGLGFAGGFATGELGGQNYDGLSTQFRVITLPLKTYPVFFLGLDSGYSRIQFKESLGFDLEGTSATVSNLEANRLTIAPFVGIMFPLDLIKEIDGLPRGAGIPFYFGYHLIDNWNFDDFTHNLNGDGFKAGMQLPIPIDAPVQITLMAEYYQSSFAASEEFPSFYNGLLDDDAKGWNFMFQIGVPLF